MLEVFDSVANGILYNSVANVQLETNGVRGWDLGRDNGIEVLSGIDRPPRPRRCCHLSLRTTGPQMSQPFLTGLPSIR